MHLRRQERSSNISQALKYWEVNIEKPTHVEEIKLPGILFAPPTPKNIPTVITMKIHKMPLPRICGWGIKLRECSLKYEKETKAYSIQLEQSKTIKINGRSLLLFPNLRSVNGDRRFGLGHTYHRQSPMLSEALKIPNKRRTCLSRGKTIVWICQQDSTY